SALSLSRPGSRLSPSTARRLASSSSPRIARFMPRRAPGAIVRSWPKRHARAATEQVEDRAHARMRAFTAPRRDHAGHAFSAVPGFQPRRFRVSVRAYALDQVEVQGLRAVSAAARPDA